MAERNSHHLISQTAKPKGNCDSNEAKNRIESTMSPKKSLNLARGRASDGEEERHHRPRHRRVHRYKSHKHRREECVTMKKKSRVTEKVKKATKMLKLEANNNKSLYICSLEHHEGAWVAYVVRAIKLSNLLTSDDELQLRQVAYKAGVDLPGSVGCGVLGSQIFFAGGLKPCVPGGLGAIRADSVWHRGVYAFETDPNKHKHDDDVIRKMDVTLLEAKFYPFMVELDGKLYALNHMRLADPPSFEVFDPTVGSWLALPQPPFFQLNSPYTYYRSVPFAYAIAGTKMFVSHEKCPVFCFDVAHPNRKWRLVPTMCRGGPFPFFGKALVLDLPADDRKKIMFAHSPLRSLRLGVYLMSLDDNQESITLIGYFKLSMWPYELGMAAEASYFVHIQGQKACLVITQFIRPDHSDSDEEESIYEPGTHKTRGVAMPFQFEFDITKVGKDKKNAFTLQFMPPRIFEYHTNPSVYPNPETVGCFVL